MGAVVHGIQQHYCGGGVPSSAVSDGRQYHGLTLWLLMSHHFKAESLQFRQNPLFSSFSVILRCIYSCCCTLNKLDAKTNGNYAIYRNLRSLGSALASGPWVLKSCSLGVSVYYLVTLTLLCMFTSLEPRLSIPDFVSQLSPMLQDQFRNGKPGFEAICSLHLSI